MQDYHTFNNSWAARRKTIPAQLRSDLLSSYPELNDPVLLAIAHRAMFGFSAKGDAPPLDYYWLAGLEGRQAQARSRDYRSLPILERFAKAVPGVEISGYRPTRGFARYAKSLGPLAEIAELSLMKGPGIRGRVDFMTGELITRGVIARDRAEFLSASKNTEPYEQVRGIRDHFANESPTWWQSELINRLPLAFDVANELVNPDDRRAALLTLETIERVPVPLLVPALNTFRLFSATGYGQTNLNRSVREVLFGLDEGVAEEWDLPQAQLTIISAMLELSAVQEFLADGGSAWQLLADDYGLPVTAPSFKDACKRGLYSLIFGAKLVNVRRYFSAECDGLYDPEPFMNNWLIRELSAAVAERLAMMRRSKPDDLVEIIPGLTIPMGAGAKSGRARTLLAFQVQAREQLQTLELFQEAEARGLQVVNYLFDGLYVRSRS